MAVKENEMVPGAKLEFVDTSHLKADSIYRGPVHFMRTLELGDVGLQFFSHVGMVVEVISAPKKDEGIKFVELNVNGQKLLCYYGPLSKNTKLFKGKK